MSKPARFLSRWSRLKRQATVETPVAPVLAHYPAAALPAAEAASAPVDSGTELGALLREELSEAVRKQALKAIFADPHFNVMDGLDTYIDDYSISEPIPPEMLATLNQVRFLFAAEDAEPAVDASDEPKVVDCDNLDRAGQKVSTDPLPELQEKDK